MKRYLTFVVFIIASSFAFCGKAQPLEEKLKSHIATICSDNNLGRKAGSPGETAVADYLYRALEKAGVEMLCPPEGDEFTIVTPEGDTIVSRNVVGVIEGTDPALRNEYIVLCAYMDHLGTYDMTVDGVRQTKILPGADADASGLAALIEAASILSQSRFELGRSVILAGLGAHEEEFSGARYFTENESRDYSDRIKLMIGLDMLGRGDLQNPFEIYPSSTALASDIAILTSYVLKNETLTVIPSVHSGLVFSSDYLAFSQAGIPALTFSTGISREYRTFRDAPALVMYGNLAAETLYTASFVRAVSNKETIITPVKQVTEGKCYSLKECDTPPQFLRKDEAHFLKDWVYKYVKYPADAVQNGIQGKVMVSFTIGPDGNVSDIVIESGVCDSIDSEVLKVIGASPKWTAGEIGGRKVAVRITLPVEEYS
ncbi:MAG: TonB family protein, partial [Bacteroidales bacterium]|nr:TonB family protein [Bacteroidales bacterium]